METSSVTRSEKTRVPELGEKKEREREHRYLVLVTHRTFSQEPSGPI